MIRALHRWAGILPVAIVIVLAVSGAVLSIFPMMERLAAPQAEAELSIATLTERIASKHPGVELISRSPSGRITAYWFENDQPGTGIIDPATGQGVAFENHDPVERWFTKLHRSLFLGDSGRITMAVGAIAMLALGLSGIMVVLRRVGGWRHWFARLRGPLSGRLHVEVSRIGVVGFMLSSLTALWMVAATFDFIPSTSKAPPFPTAVSGETGVSFSELELLKQTPVSQLRVLTFPYPGDETDVFTLKTYQGTGYLDQGTGELLGWSDLTRWERVFETIYMLHTGQGAASLGLILGLMVLGIPLLGITGVLIWLAGRRGRPRIRNNQSPAHAETIVLVGSEGGSTWGFAATLHSALHAAGQSVHLARMSAFMPGRYPRAKRILILAATYGDGDAPEGAQGFLDRVTALDQAPDIPLAILGFGDRNFPSFCGFATDIAAAARAKNWPELIPFDTIDRQSPQSFARWGRALGAAMGLELELSHQPILPKTQDLTLISSRKYGAQAPTTILRFSLPAQSVWQRIRGVGFARFSAGDLIGILPEGSPLPRFYSLASAAQDGFIEFVVRQHPGGLCSGQLTTLAPGDTIQAFLRPNPEFHPSRGRAPLILIGAGTGVGPLIGFVRNNRHPRPIHLFFGMRHLDHDFLYREEMDQWLAQGQLTQLTTAVSRCDQPRYVQDALRSQGDEIAQLLNDGARIMVCGAREMAHGVKDALAHILEPTALRLTTLRAQGQYVEDVY